MFPESKFHAKTFRSGFTLIELLVVIAIIALLVSILLPSLQKAKDLAKGVVCKSNIKGIGMAYSLYAADSDNWLPMCYDGGISGVPAGTYRWYLLFQEDEYAPSGLFVCPSEPSERLSADGLGYGMNVFINNSVDSGLDAWIWKIDSFNNPDKFILIADSNDDVDSGAQAVIAPDDNWRVNTFPNCKPAKRHPNEYANDLRVDGHVDSRLTYYMYADSDEILWDPSWQNN